MEQYQGKITFEQIYTSRLSARRVEGKDGWHRWVPFPGPASTGCTFMDDLAKVLAEVPIPPIEEIAARMGMNRKELGVMVRCYTKIPLTDFLNSYRLRMAKELLVYTTLTVTDIAWCSGISRSHFLRIFTRELDCDPSDYRVLHQKPGDAKKYRWDKRVLGGRRR